MTRFRGRQPRSRLVDMGIYPQDEDCHEPPPEEDTEKVVYRLQLPEGHRAGVVQTFRVGSPVLVHFSLFQALKVEGVWQPIMRIDSWHGTIHRHDFTPDGINRVTILERLQQERRSRSIERWRDQAEDLMMTEWEENVRRWRGDTR